MQTKKLKREYMKSESYKLFKTAPLQEILEVLDKELQTRNESPFWSDKVVPFSAAILSVLIPLRDADMLFDPEGKPQAELTPELFFRWSDFVSLKTLAFTVERSNKAGKLLRTDLPEDVCEKYKEIELETLGDYLSKNNVDLQNESLDFPIATYNLHQGVSNVIKSLL